MLADQLIKEGELTESLAQLKEEVRKDPSNSKYRVFLFQLLSLTGEWDKALNQLKVAGELDAGTLAMVQTYREAIRCEVLREEVFAGQRLPLVFGDPEQWVALVIEALRLTAEGKYAQSQRMREEAFESAAATPGSVDDVPFEWIADADSRLGPILEAIINGRYYWIPFQRIRSIQLEKPEDLRDLVWAPAYFTWANGGETVGLIPTRYPGSQHSDNERICMSRNTEWQEHEGGVFLGMGQRMLVTEKDEYPVLDISLISLSREDTEQGSESTDA